VTSTGALRRFSFGYAVAFSIFYPLARAWGVALFTVYPSLGVVLLGLHRSRDAVDPAVEFLAPEMWWYGWTATAVVGATAVALVFTCLPERRLPRFGLDWLWLTPALAMIVCAYLTLPWFRM
jgi:hypothetical protein